MHWKHSKTGQNTKSVLCWWNRAIWSKKCLKHLKTAQNIKSLIIGEMSQIWNYLKPKTAKSAQNSSKLHYLVKWAIWSENGHLLVKLSIWSKNCSKCIENTAKLPKTPKVSFAGEIEPFEAKIASFSGVMSHLISKQKHQTFHLLLKWNKSA